MNNNVCSDCLCTFINLSVDAVDEDLHLSLAHQMYKSGNYKKALEHSNTVYERNPLRTDNLLLLGAIYYQVSLSFIMSVLSVICWTVYLQCLASSTYFLFHFVLHSERVVLFVLQLHDFDMCVAKNEEALRIEPHFAECYGNMANAWKVSNCR